MLEPLARRHAAGESGRELSTELYNVVHPWAVSFAKSQSAGLPAHADRNEVLSQVLRLTWDACARIDWSRVESWTTFLDTKVGRARVEAARRDDWLSRQERVRRRWFQRETARLEQIEQRTLTDAERLAVANTLTPNSAHVDWARSLLDSRHPSSVAEVPDVGIRTNRRLHHHRRSSRRPRARRNPCALPDSMDDHRCRAEPATGHGSLAMVRAE